jgi:alkaline phosphatase D
MAGAGFANGQLTDMVAVGRVSPRSAWLWVRSGQPGNIRIEWAGTNRTEMLLTSIDARDHGDRDLTLIVRIPGDAADGLEPSRKYRFRVVREDDAYLLGEGGFNTPPEPSVGPDGQFCFAVMSCHQPFDANGMLLDAASRMLEAVRDRLAQRDAKYVLMVGDQMYADFPEPLSLFNEAHFKRVAPAGKITILDCAAAEVRRLYQERYRAFWNQPSWRKLHSDRPCYPILDDHDIVDNWGSRTDRPTEKWRAFSEGARAAYFDYQGSRAVASSPDGIPNSFHYSFEWGDTATFVFDLRSSRTPGPEGRLLAGGQLGDFEAFLVEHQNAPVLFLVFSVPLFHIPQYVAKTLERLPLPDAEDFSDRWSSAAHCRDRDRLLDIIKRHQKENPLQRVVLLSGDIHIGCAHMIRWRGTEARLYQLVSSPITHATSPLYANASKLMMRMRKTLHSRDGEPVGTVRSVPGEMRGMKNPYCRLNVGIVQIRNPKHLGDPCVKFELHGWHNGELELVYRSLEL